MSWIKNRIPTLYNAEFFKKKLNTEGDTANKISIVEGSVEITFEMFWEQYPKKEHRKRAEKFWDGMTKGKRHTAYTAVFAFRKHCILEEWYNPPLPDRYLREEDYWTGNYKK